VYFEPSIGPLAPHRWLRAQWAERRAGQEQTDEGALLEELLEDADEALRRLLKCRAGWVKRSVSLSLALALLHWLPLLIHRAFSSALYHLASLVLSHKRVYA
jgi:hypothetical protein